VFFNDPNGADPNSDGWNQIQESRNYDMERNYYNTHGIYGDDDMYGMMFGKIGAGVGNWYKVTNYWMEESGYKDDKGNFIRDYTYDYSYGYDTEMMYVYENQQQRQRLTQGDLVIISFDGSTNKTWNYHELTVEFGYKGNVSGYADVNWVQTVRRGDDPAGPFNDPKKGNGNYPFYYSKSQNKDFRNVDGYASKFADRPRIPFSSGNTSWQAELSLVGIGPDGKNSIILTVNYGFSINSGKITLSNPTFSISPSEFHLNSIFGK
jgi:hypothetical protein